MPLMRADWPLLKNYRFCPDAPLNCPITAFAARQDDMVYTDEIREWERHTGAGFELIEVDGDHWFLNRNRERILAKFQEIADRSCRAVGEWNGLMGPHATGFSAQPVSSAQ